MPLDFACDRLSVMRAIAANQVEWLVKDERFHIGVDWSRYRFATVDQQAELDGLMDAGLVQLGGDCWYGSHPTRKVVTTAAGDKWLARAEQQSQR